MSDPSSSVTLNTGTRMPLLGLGTYRLRGFHQIHAAVDAALAAGYRVFDTAAVYENEADLGLALRDLLPKHSLTRTDIFVISKLGPADQGSRAREGCVQSLEQLGLEYIDLYLVHWPGTEGLCPGDALHRENRAHSWAVLQEFHTGGKFRAIGVSNYTVGHLRELLESGGTPPAVLQAELHPKLAQVELRTLCREAGVCFQAHTSLGAGALLADPVVLGVAEGCGRSPAQVLLRWAVQQSVPVLPMSSHPERVAENAQIFGFQLSEEEMGRLSAQDCGRRFCRRDPSTIP
ncbi:uncharacterized oxidoreductase Mflv_4205-like [Megalops cyprinoides]|uniref:uncharacterized oxidoreductase Mflv_4205-like n=1 Tax=Megalops cyprinoides TaxID=118141 RepID=UPI001864E907|nr:uncharacterized oxidoreductase Mflv_4205-like [Megalops cyprinoides]